MEAPGHMPSVPSPKSGTGKHTPSTVTIIASSTSKSGTGSNIQQCTAR